jgi:hypothetical protein
MKEMVKRYGEAVSMEDYCNKMQLMNAAGYQGIFEAAGHKLNDIGGVMLWKINSAFPSVVWQVYDWFLMPNAGYYFMQNACEPVHLQLNMNDYKVLAINRTYKSFSGLVAQTEVYDIDSKSLFREEKALDLNATEVKEISSLSSVLANSNGIIFIVLNLKDKAGKEISHNVYWLSKNGDCRALNDMQKTTLDSKLVSVVKDKTESRWTIQITNKTSRIAFFIRPQLLTDGEEVLPGFWTSGYFTLAPSETRIVTVSCPLFKLDNVKPEIVISGWNVEEQILTLK